MKTLKEVLIDIFFLVIFTLSLFLFFTTTGCSNRNISIINDQPKECILGPIVQGYSEGDVRDNAEMEARLLLLNSTTTNGITNKAITINNNTTITTATIVLWGVWEYRYISRTSPYKIQVLLCNLNSRKE